MMSEPFGFQGEKIRVKYQGHTVDVFLIPNLPEIQKRRNAGFHCIEDRDSLEALSSLPFKLRIAWDEIDPVSAASLDTLPDAVVKKTRDHVVSLYRPPILITGVLKMATVAESAFHSLDYFVRCAPRELVLKRTTFPGAALARARHLGIGLVWEQSDRSYQRLLNPSRKHLRSDELTWLILERVYGLYSHSAHARS